MYDHMHQRGYVQNIPGAPMCGCVEQMPSVSRSDCTQVDLTETVKVTYDPDDAETPFTSKITHVDVDFNGCQGATKFQLNSIGMSVGYHHDAATWTKVAGRDALRDRDHHGRRPPRPRLPRLRHVPGDPPEDPLPPPHARPGGVRPPGQPPVPEPRRQREQRVGAGLLPPLHARGR